LRYIRPLASFDIRWSGDGDSSVQTDGSLFSFDAVVSSATVEWEGLNQTTGAHFVSDAALHLAQPLRGPRPPEERRFLPGVGQPASIDDLPPAIRSPGAAPVRSPASARLDCLHAQ
jgi:hypothetical protein